MSEQSLHIESLENILSVFFSNVTHPVEAQQSLFLRVMTSIYNQCPLDNVHPFALDDCSTANAINQLKDCLKQQNPNCMNALNSPLTYLLDELICNIQQHAQVDKGYAFIAYNQLSRQVEIIVADLGITIYGSYVAAQKHLDKLGNSDAEALNLAQSGYSVKNLPNAENRGYGISSNIKMVVEGLHGEFATLSGNALMLHSTNKRQILALPPEIDFKGTMIIATIPEDVPADFNLYNYTS